MKKNKRIFRLTVSALMLATALLLPFLTGQVQKFGQMLCPMHVPVLVCAFLCGPVWAGAVGFAAPLLRYALFGMPILFPMGVSMAPELACLGVVCGVLARSFRTLSDGVSARRRLAGIYASLLASMLAARTTYGIVRFIILFAGGPEFSLAAFVSGVFVESLPGIILQLVLVPSVVLSLRRFALRGSMHNAD